MTVKTEPPPPTQEQRQSYMEAFKITPAKIELEERKVHLDQIPEKTLKELGFTSVTDMINILVVMKVAGWIGTMQLSPSDPEGVPTPKNLEELRQLIYEEGGVDMMRKMAEAWLEVRHQMTFDDLGKVDV